MVSFLMHVSHERVIEMNDEIWFVDARKSGLYRPMLKAMLAQVFNMLSHYKRVHIVRFDLHIPDYTNDNSIITTFNRRLRQKLKQKYKINKIGFIWVREKAKRQHYHFALMLDGKAIQYPNFLLKNIVAPIWQNLGGSIHYPDNGYYNLARDNKDTIQPAIERISYFAKGRGKGYKPPQTKNYGTSRIKPKKATI
jgi:hypothetical protein